MIEAGSETTSMFLNNAIVGLLSNPVVIEKCQEELDRVIGSDRTPTMEDVKDLPWTRSVVKVLRLSMRLLTLQEVLRWRPANKLGTNHYVTEDDWYEGYFIPKGSIIMLNHWALHYNEEEYPEPEKVLITALLDR